MAHPRKSKESRRALPPESKAAGRKRAGTAQEISVPTASQSWTVYILRCADDTFYTGITNAPNRRLEQHSRGKASRYTRARLPVAMIYQEQVDCQGDALRREAALKRLKRQEKLALIAAAAAALARPKTRRSFARIPNKKSTDGSTATQEPRP